MSRSTADAIPLAEALSEAAPRRIPLAEPWIGQRERELVQQVLESTTLAMGPFTERFEEAVAALSGRRYGVACSSGTAGLHMAVSALGIGEGDEVITTPFSFVASANCLLYERAIPRFVDIEDETLGLDPAAVVGAANDRTVGILPVHVFGRPCRIDELEQLARERDWRLIEDSCEALGSRTHGRAAGSFGDASVFAFYPNKQITTGEGGMVVTDDPDVAATMRSLRNQGRDEDGTWLRHVRLGYNYRLDEISAALGVAQLERLDELRAGRARVAAAYAELLGDETWLTLPDSASHESVDWFVYVVRLAPDLDRDEVMGSLARSGIPSRPYFSPLHLQPLYRERLGHGPGDFPVAERVAMSTLALPWSPRMAWAEVEQVALALKAAVRGDRARDVMQAVLVGPEAPAWQAALGDLEHDLYHLPGYARFSARWEEPGEPFVFIAEDDDGVMLLPLILRAGPIALGSPELQDAVSPRFYPGPLFHVAPGADAERFACRAIDTMKATLADAGVVSAFVRLHPLYTPRLAALRHMGALVDHGDTVSVDLTLTEEALWSQTRHNHRRDIHKAIRAGYRFRIDDSWNRLDDFVRVYSESMERLDAATIWRLPLEYFVELREQVGHCLHLAVVERDGEVASAALLTEVGDLVEYHLGGTADAHLPARPAKLLLHEAARWAKARRRLVFHLAGSLRRGDNLQHFKLGFSPILHPVYSWRIVADGAAYAGLAEAVGASAESPEGFFPAYRRPPVMSVAS